MEQSIETNQETTVVTYPTTPDAEGFYYESENEEDMGIMTRVYENGNKVKRAFLPSLGKTAIVRELIATDHVLVSRLTDGVQEKFLMAGIAIATKIDEIIQPIEVIAKFKMKDYNRLVMMHQALNF